MNTEEKIQFITSYGYKVTDHPDGYEITNPFDDDKGFHVIGPVSVLDEAIEMIIDY